MTTSHPLAIDHFKMLSSIVVAQNLAGQVAHHGRCRVDNAHHLYLLVRRLSLFDQGSSQGWPSAVGEDALCAEGETASSPIARRIGRTLSPGPPRFRQQRWYMAIAPLPSPIAHQGMPVAATASAGGCGFFFWFSTSAPQRLGIELVKPAG